MLNALSLNVGDFFAESSTKESWFINKKSLTDGARECLETLGDADQSVILRYFVNQSLRSPAHADFDHIAFFVTSGFENWLELSRPKISHSFSRNLKNIPASNVHDTTFGMNERVDAKAMVVQKLETSDLEFIASKLELLSVRTIAVGFLHSNLNSENEKAIKSFFVPKGFQVFLSSEEKSSLPETQRWQNTLFKARKAYREQKIEAELETLRTQYKNLKVERLTSDGNAVKLEPLESHLHLGLESFSVRDGDGIFVIDISAASPIVSGFYNTPEFSNEATTFDPGPMIMGKSFAPSLIDFLFATGNLSQVESLGISAVSADRAKPRILEAILALVRNNQERKHIDIQKELLGLEKILAYRLWSEILRVSSFRRLKVSGPLSSPGLIKILKAWRPQGIEIMTHE